VKTINSFVISTIPPSDARAIRLMQRNGERKAFDAWKSLVKLAAFQAGGLRRCSSTHCAIVFAARRFALHTGAV
jgi:hypothetical protein